MNRVTCVDFDVEFNSILLKHLNRLQINLTEVITCSDRKALFPDSVRGTLMRGFSLSACS